MTVQFYKNSSPLNQVVKSIALTDTLDCSLKENCSVINPTVEVIGTNALNANYMYIPLFSRYYIIQNITTTEFDALLVNGHVDVLMSFKESILGAQGVINRQQNMVTSMLQDDKMPLLITQNVQVKTFSSGFLQQPNYALIVSGGYNSFIS